MQTFALAPFLEQKEPKFLKLCHWTHHHHPGYVHPHWNQVHYCFLAPQFSTELVSHSEEDGYSYIASPANPTFCVPHFPLKGLGKIFTAPFLEEYNICKLIFFHSKKLQVAYC